MCSFQQRYQQDNVLWVRTKVKRTDCERFYLEQCTMHMTGLWRIVVIVTRLHIVFSEQPCAQWPYPISIIIYVCIKCSLLSSHLVCVPYRQMYLCGWISCQWNVSGEREKENYHHQRQYKRINIWSEEMRTHLFSSYTKIHALTHTSTHIHLVNFMYMWTSTA